MKLFLTSEPFARRVRTWASAHYPYEACGLLLGRKRRGGILVDEALRLDNQETTHRRDRYRLSPEGWLDAERRAARLDAEIVGVWHSHPDRDAFPSERDLQQVQPGYAYLIVSVRRFKVSELRCWRSVGALWDEIEVSESFYEGERIEHGAGSGNPNETVGQALRPRASDRR